MRSVLPLVTLAAVSLASTAQAADTLPLGSLEPDATAAVSRADALPDGSIRGALAARGNESAAPTRAVDARLAAAEGDGDLLRDANSMSLLVGLGISRTLGLSLGLHGTYEHVAAEQRDAIFPVEDAAGDSGWRGSFRPTALSGASMLLKVRLLDVDGLRLAAAPFVESGAGESATYSLTRSVGPKGGLLGIASYGAPGVADVSFNLGWRYRDPETLGAKTLRHEMLYRGLVEGFLSKTFRLFVAGEGRRLMIADESSSRGASAERAYEPQYAGAVHGGFKVDLGSAELTAFAGGKAGKADSVGYGRRSFGVSLAYEMGNFRGRRAARTSFAADVERDEEAKKARQAVETAGPQRPKSFVEEVEAVFPPQGDYAEMQVDASEAALQEAGDGITDGDFKSSEKAAAQHRLKQGELSEDEKVRQELEAIKQADAKAEAERQARELAEEERERKARARRAHEDEKLMKEWMQEAQHEADSIPGIESDEMSWQGLED